MPLKPISIPIVGTNVEGSNNQMLFVLLSNKDNVVVKFTVNKRYVLLNETGSFYI